MSQNLSHLDEEGRAQMVDVTGKTATRRRAVARGRVNLKTETLEAIRQGSVEKGEVLAVARLAGVMASKRTSELIPLCHPLALQFAGIEFTLPESAETQGGEPGRVVLEITATVSTEAKTGVEMEALSAVSVAALTIYDMCKGIDRSIRIEQIVLIEKTGGKSDFRLEEAPD